MKKQHVRGLILGSLVLAGEAVSGPRVSVEETVRTALSSVEAKPVEERVTSVEFPPQPARQVRLVILSTHGGAVCLDELEVFGPAGKENLALASRGAVAQASSVIFQLTCVLLLRMPLCTPRKLFLQRNIACLARR